VRYNEFLQRKTWPPGSLLHRVVMKRYLQEIIRRTGLIPERCDALEVGCGTGELLAEMQNSNFKSVSGIEPNENLANYARKSNPNIPIFNLSLPSTISNINKKFDLIICIHLIEHAPNGYEARTWLSSMKEQLKDGGKLVIISPEVNSYKFNFWEIDWSHCFPTSLGSLKQIANDLQFDSLFSGYIRLGSTRKSVNFLASAFSLMIPTRILDWIGVLIFQRKIGMGLKAAFFWANIFLVVGKPDA
jgi:SAM-dependent methyltransferase